MGFGKGVLLFILLVVDPDFGVLPVVPYLRFSASFSCGFARCVLGDDF